MPVARYPALLITGRRTSALPYVRPHSSYSGGKEVLARIAEFAARRRWQVVIAWVLILIGAGAGAARVDSVLGPGSFVQKGSDSDRAATLLDRYFHQNDQRVTLVLVRDP